MYAQNIHPIEATEESVRHNDNRPTGNSFESTLAHLNMSVFRQLRKLGTEPGRICNAMNLSRREYDYICTIS